MKIELIFEDLNYNYQNVDINNKKYTLGISQEPYSNTIDVSGNNIGFEMVIYEGEEYKLKIINGLLKLLEIDCELVI